jgi:hypothetical protein
MNQISSLRLPIVTAPGVYDLPETTYHSDPAPRPSLSATIAKTLLTKTPLHAWLACPRLNPNWEPLNKKTFDIGRAAHREVLGRGGDWVEIPSDLLATNGAASTKAAKEFIEGARANGQTPLKADEAQAVGDIAEKVKLRLGTMGITLQHDRSEMAAFAELDGVWCRCLVDNAPENARSPLYDLKTTTDANPDKIARAIVDYGYDVQAQHYREVWKAATGEDRPFRFIFVEKDPPYEVCVVELTGEDLMMAEKRISRARAIFRDCLAANDWPGYPLQVVQVKLPEFYQARWLEREGTEAAYMAQTGADIINAARVAAQGTQP